MKTLSELRRQYEEICEVRLSELYLPEEKKTLKTETFVSMERELVFMCAKEKKKMGLIQDCEMPGATYGMNYGVRKNGSWRRGNRRALGTIEG